MGVIINQIVISHGRNLPNDTGTIPLYHNWLTLTPLSFAIIKVRGYVNVLLILQTHRKTQHNKKPTPSERGICAFLGLLSCWVLVIECKRREALSSSLWDTQVNSGAHLGSCIVQESNPRVLIRGAACCLESEPWRYPFNIICCYLLTNPSLFHSLSPQSKYM